MTDITIQPGDEVMWNFGNGHPTGTVAEVKTSGQLEIETKGKLVHKNADPENPAVHVERSGNDVVKRASELTRLESVTEASDSDAGVQVEPPAAQEQGEFPSAEATIAKPAPKKRGRKKSSAAAAVGEKRERAEGEAETTTAAGEGGAEQAAVEVETGKKTKKAKTGEAGEKKHPGRPSKGSKAKKAQDDHPEGEAHAEGTAEHGGEGAPKKKGPGRPKKSDASDHPPAEHASIDQDAPAARTRSHGT
ncbi:hypothetical protein DXG03_000436 [Asterophora parasitica]|uniref:Hypervirulence associated protein TUDOR domain-containing protein n=1 Tax=Asterophora parasitica TaxID=117018 RepID=A0A9P7KEA1_9AGAR|nr:hypothetical protein DXG03_000436 [Asterophora parasitica]